MAAQTIDEYISSCPKEVQPRLQTIRTIVKELAPRAQEAISYGMPTFKLNKKILVHFAAWKNHIGSIQHLLVWLRFKRN